MNVSSYIKWLQKTTRVNNVHPICQPINSIQLKKVPVKFVIIKKLNAFIAVIFSRNLSKHLKQQHGTLIRKTDQKKSTYNNITDQNKSTSKTRTDKKSTYNKVTDQKRSISITRTDQTKGTSNNKTDQKESTSLIKTDQIKNTYKKTKTKKV